MAGNTITLTIAADVKSLVSGVDQTNKKLAGLNKSVQSGAGVLKGALAADVVAAGVRKIADSVGEAYATVQQQQELGAQTAAVLKSTGAAAGVSADQVRALADSIESKSKIDSEAIQQGQNLLLTFTNIKNEAGAGNDIFNQTTQIMADMATAMGSDPKASAIQLGKALNDPIKGVSALSKVGVSFTDQQKAQIKAMQEAGDTAGAQKIILAELNKEFGGSAEAAGQTFGGAMYHIKGTLDGVLEGILSKALPTIQSLATWFADNLPGAVDTLGRKFGEISAKLAPVVAAFSAFVDFLRANPETVKAFAITIGILAAAVGIVTAVQWAWNVAMTANPIGIIIVGIGLLVAAIVYLVTHWDQVSAKVAEVWAKVWAATKGAWDRLIGWLKSSIDSVVAFHRAMPGRVWSALSSLASQVSSRAREAGSALVSAISSKILEALTWFASLNRRILAAIVGAATLLHQTGINIIQGLINGLANKIGAAISWAAGIGGKVKGAVGALGSLLYQSGRDVVQGLINGLDASLSAVQDKARQIASAVTGAVKNALSIRSPSRVFDEIGRNIGAGLVGGLDAKLPRLREAALDLAAAVMPDPINLADALTIGSLATPDRLTAAGAGMTVYVTVNAPVGSSPVEIGRELTGYLNAYTRAGGRA